MIDDIYRDTNMPITTLKVNEQFIVALSRVEQGLEDDSTLQPWLAPKFTDEHLQTLELETQRIESINTSEYWKNLDLNALDPSSLAITSTGIYIGNAQDGIIVDWQLNQTFSSLAEIEYALENGLQDKLFRQITLTNNGDPVIKVSLESSGFSVIAADSIVFKVEGYLPTSISEFENISQTLDVISDFLSSSSSVSEELLASSLANIIQYDAQLISLSFAGDELLSITFDETVRELSLGGLALSFNGYFPEVNSYELAASLAILRDSDMFDPQGLLASPNAQLNSVTLTNSDGLQLLSIDGSASTEAVTADLETLSSGIDAGLWVNSAEGLYNVADVIEPTLPPSSIEPIVPIVSGEYRIDGQRDDYMVSRSGDSIQIFHNDFGEYLVGVERLHFNDTAIAFDFDKDQSGYKAATLIGTAFGAEYIDDYFSIGVHFFDNNATIAEIATLIDDLGLIESMVGQSNEAWVTHVYENVVGFQPNDAELALYTGYLDSGYFNKADLLVLAQGVSLIDWQVNIAGLKYEGIEFTPFG